MRLNKIKTYTLNSDAKCNTSALNLLDFPFLGAAFASSKCSGRRRVVRPDEHVWKFFELLRHLSLKLFDQEPTLANSIIIWNDLALDHWPRRFGRCGINGKCYAVVIVDPHSTVSSLYANHSDRRRIIAQLRGTLKAGKFIVDQILGHAPRTMTAVAAGYYHGNPLDVLREALEKVALPMEE